MAREMRLPKDLQPEQLDVLNRATAPNPNEFIFVQGVAGSGKTTIALNIARKIGELNATRPVESRQTILFLTYNDRLAEYCRNTLMNQSTITKMVVSEKTSLQDGSINVMTVSGLFRLAVNLQGKDRFLSDEECVAYISTIAAQRGIRELLPSQIFSLISTFLRGRPELCDKKIDELNAIIDRDMSRSVHYRMYGESLQEIRRRLLSTYEDWKRGVKGLDRSDCAKQLHNQLLEIEDHLYDLPTLQAEYLRKISRHRLGDGDSKTLIPLEWADQAFKAIQEIPRYEDRVRLIRSSLASESINTEKLNSLRDTLFSSIPDVGLRGSTLWQPICSHLKSPLIIVDEIQDLSPIECENLISLWFQMSRTKESHLILLGDLNQQITPSGFEWETIYALVDEKAELYHQKVIKPDDHKLDNNYRTTEEIARFVHSVMENVAPSALADKEIADRFLRHSINPKNTLSLSLGDRIEQIKQEGGDLVPHVLVGSKSLFKQGLEKYIEILKSQEETRDEEKLLSTVIITEHGSQVDDLISQDLSKYVIDNDIVEVIPVLSCKGLEFDRCVLHGLSIKKLGEIEQDLVSRWYTSFTRAKLQLLIYLTDDEFKFIQGLGWKKIPADVVLVKKVSSADDIALELEQLGKTNLDEDARYSIGEASLARFIQTGNEDFLQKSLRLLKQGGLNDRYLQVAAQGADWYEKQKNYLKAADYYHDAEASVDEVRCLALHVIHLETGGIGNSQMQEYYDRATRVAEDAPDYELQARCWVLIREYDKALNAAVKSGEKALQEEIASQIAEEIRLLAEKKPNDAAIYAEILEENQYWEATALSWLSLGDWERAFKCSKQSANIEIQAKFAKKASAIAHDATKKKADDARAIADKLDENKYFDLAAPIWQQLRDYLRTVQSLVNYGNLDGAESIVKKPDYKVAPEHKKEMYFMLAKGLRKEQSRWPQAYYYFHLAEHDTECDRIELECRNLNDYRTLAACYRDTRKFDKVVSLANELDLMGDDKKELIAECWEMAEEWERATNSWMKLFFEHIERVEELFGPKPERNELPNRNSLKRFYDNLEKYRNEYKLEFTDWEILTKYEINPRRLIENNAQIVKIISQSDRWQSETADFLKLIRDRSRYATLGNPTDIGKAKLPEKLKKISSDELLDFWNKFDVVNDVFQQRAVAVSRECFQKADKLLGIRLMNSVCMWRNEAIKLSDELAQSNDDLWIQSWKILEYSNDSIERRIFGLHPTNQSNLIRKAIYEVYQDSPAYRQTMWEKYRDKLIGIGNKKANELLRKHFPDFQPEKFDNIDAIPEKIEVADLIKEMSGSLDRLAVNDATRIELGEQFSSMLGVIGEKERLATKWKMAKSILLEGLDDRLKVKVEQLDLLIQGVQVEKKEISRNVEKFSEKNPPSAASSRTRTRHRSKQTINDTVQSLQKLDLHEYSLDDAQKAFETAFDDFDDDKSVGALLIVHGYGKDKHASVIKEWLNERTRRLQRHKRVRKVIKGEEISDAFGENVQIIQQSVENLDFSEIGTNNPGITVIVFNRN